MQPTLFEQALDLLIFGMGTVFVFLAILVIAINLMSRFVGTFFPEAIVPEATFAPVKPSSGELDKTTLAVIQAAIRQHRDHHNSNK